MTKRQYLKKLENCIQALPVEERTEALEYYSNYFDDADDDDKVMQELGSPEELAKTIIEKFTCVPAKSTKKRKTGKTTQNNFATSESDEFTENTEDVFDASDNAEYIQDKLCFEFEKKNVVNLGLCVGACDVFIKNGDTFKIETRCISKKDFRCEINQSGTLIVENRKFPSDGKKYRQAFKNKWCPRILITLPQTKLKNCKIVLGAGQVRSKDLKIKTEKLMVETSAGNMFLDGINSESANIHCSVGNVKVKGLLTGFSKIDVSMGAVVVKMPCSQEDYSCNAKVGLGSIKFGEQKYKGFNQSFNATNKKNHFNLNVGLGDIKIKFEG